MTKVVDAIKANGAKPISANELCKLFSITPQTVRGLVNQARRDGICICSCTKGYFFSEDEYEVERTINSLKHRIIAIQQAIDGLACRLGELNGCDEI